MSQNWHAHWMEENYRPTRLGNWEVPKWHSQWPVKHCGKTNFQCDNKGHLLAHLKKTNHERNTFKTAWELPKKINRQLAQELSAPLQYRMKFWNDHERFHRKSCEEKEKEEMEKKFITRNGKKSENILTKQSSIVQNEVKPEPLESEGNEKLKPTTTTITTVLDIENFQKSINSSDFNDNIKSGRNSSQLNIKSRNSSRLNMKLERNSSGSVRNSSDSNNIKSERNLNKVCNLHQTSKI